MRKGKGPRRSCMPPATGASDDTCIMLSRVLDEGVGGRGHSTRVPCCCVPTPMAGARHLPRPGRTCSWLPAHAPPAVISPPTHPPGPNPHPCPLPGLPLLPPLQRPPAACTQGCCSLTRHPSRYGRGRAGGWRVRAHPAHTRTYLCAHACARLCARAVTVLMQSYGYGHALHAARALRVRARAATPQGGAGGPGAGVGDWRFCPAQQQRGGGGGGPFLACTAAWLSSLPAKVGQRHTARCSPLPCPGALDTPPPPPPDPAPLPPC